MQDGTWLDAFLNAREVAAFSKAAVLAYRACNALMASSPILGNFVVGREQRPYLRRAHMEHYLADMCAHVRSLTYEIRQNSAKNTSFVVVRKKNLFVTAHYVETPGQQARYARCRQEMAAAYSGDLFAGRYGGMDQHLKSHKGPVYLELVHTSNEDGHLNSLDFVLPMPSQDRIVAIAPVPFEQTTTKPKTEEVSEKLDFKKRDRRPQNEHDDPDSEESGP